MPESAPLWRSSSASPPLLNQPGGCRQEVVAMLSNFQSIFCLMIDVRFVSKKDVPMLGVY